MAPLTLSNRSNPNPCMLQVSVSTCSADALWGNVPLQACCSPAPRFLSACTLPVLAPLTLADRFNP